MPEFENYTIEFEKAISPEDEVVVTGPPVACVAWIPFYVDLADMPTSDYKNHRLAKSFMLPSALSILFWSGNPSDPGSDSNPSPASFSDRTQFLKFIETKNYRAAIALDEIKCVMTKAGKPLRLSFKSLADVGYTPMRVDIGSMLLTYYDKGRGSADFDVVPDSVQEELSIKFWIRFKIGRLGDFGSFVFTGGLAPSASMSLEYRLDTNGRVSIDFAGSYIPSQSLYVNWTRTSLHDMIGNSSAMIDAFLDAGACQDAPIWNDKVE